MKLTERLKALADPTRLRIYGVLLKRELNVNELIAVFGMGQSRISRHLKILTDSGLLQCRKDGLWSFYSADLRQTGTSWADLIRQLGYGQEREDAEAAARVFKQRTEDTAKFFNTVAQDWGRLKQDLLAGADLEKILARLVPKCAVAVDLGCGTGDLLPLLSRKARKVIGVDNAPGMLDEARKRHRVDPARVSLRVGELAHLPLRDGEADCAVMTFVLHHVSEPEKVIAEIAKVIKNGKTFVLIDLSKHQDESLRTRYHDRWLGFTPHEVRTWLHRAGLAVETETVIPLKNGLEAFALRARKKEK
jgi:ubiquinone/menaquinone biosynthesis C-methylase UbiE